jgi:hypothetical protein
MPAPYDAPMPPDLELAGTYTVRLLALDPTSGAVVPGVIVSQVVMMVNAGAGTTVDELAVGPFMLVPGPEA